MFQKKEKEGVYSDEIRAFSQKRRIREELDGRLEYSISFAEDFNLPASEFYITIAIIESLLYLGGKRLNNKQIGKILSLTKYLLKFIKKQQQKCLKSHNFSTTWLLFFILSFPTQLTVSQEYGTTLTHVLARA